MIESPGWRAYCGCLEELINAALLSIDSCTSIEDFQRVKHTVRAYKTAIEYPNTLIERQANS